MGAYDVVMFSILTFRPLTKRHWKGSILCSSVINWTISANHLYSLVSHVLTRNVYGSSKFYEYCLHHGMAVFLIFYSYMLNLWLVGSMVLIFHDFSDAFLIVGRFYMVLVNSRRI